MLGELLKYPRGMRTKTWTKNQQNEVQVMYTQKEINKVLRIYDKLRS